ncbi:ATP-binding protein [Pseudoalteromonas mariniglutinosa]|uniref:sensor histidine kinase n=1 Tax=Pseudoalteromonas mariniglutinosa TaxID=206042 RepID=UPI00385048E9
MKKFYISLLGSALLSIIVLGWLIDAFSQQTHQPNDEFSLQSNMLQGFSQQLTAQPNAARPTFVKQLSDDFNIQLEYRLTQSLALPASLLSEINKPSGLILEDQQGFYLLYGTEQLAPYHLKLRLEKDTSLATNHDVLLTLLFYTGLCVFMAFIIAPLAKRLSVLNDAAKRFAQGDLTTRLPISHFTYIKDVEFTFNRMASQIEKLLDENKLMASSLSHDIRTPIACLRFGLDAALECQNSDKVHGYLTRMEHDLEQMESMLKSYLIFATLEQKANKLTYESSELSCYLNTVIQQATPKLNSQQRILNHHIDKGLIDADLHWLARAIINLLNNACDFAEHHVLLTAKLTSQHLILTVEDDGPGVDEQNREKIFRPFFQAQSHRNRSDKSYGLGLAIAAKVADWHHGSVTVSSSHRLKGACFTITIHNRAKM